MSKDTLDAKEEEGSISARDSNGANDGVSLNKILLVSAATSLEKTLTKTVWAMRFAVFADAIAPQVLGPNYALLVLKGGSQVSESG